MSRSKHSGPLLSERLFRGVALFFLLFSLANTVFPPPCSDDCAMHRIESTPVASYDQSVIATAVVASDAPSPNPPPERHCGDEDCCFGCAHMLISTITGVAVYDLKSPDAIPSTVFLPAPAVRLTDHPPRFA
jgi:hypothetical protein